MAASLADLTQWFDDGLAAGATHMVIKCDTFDDSGDCCYPVYVYPGQSAREIAELGNSLLREVYVLDPGRRAEQLSPGRTVMNYDPPAALRS